jgi:hypothetical protein
MKENSVQAKIHLASVINRQIGREATRQQKEFLRKAKDGLYWPEKALPFGYVNSLITIANYSSKIYSIFREAVSLYQTPGCQAVLEQCNFDNNEVSIMFQNVNQTINGDNVLTDKLPNNLLPYLNDPDYGRLVAKIEEYIKTGFNRQKNIIDDKLKVEPSQISFVATFFRTLIDHCKM